MRRDALAALVVALLAAVAPALALRFSRPVLLDFGPNDADYVRGFRQDWERDGRTRFHWTTQAANVRLPLLVAGEGPLLRLRYRRHFVEPATVRLTVEGRTAATFQAQADPKLPYRVVQVPLPELAGRHPFIVSIEAPSELDRPLGIALDWMELQPQPGSRFALLTSTLLRFVLAGLAAFLIPRLAGAPPTLALSHATGLVALGAWGAQRNALAFERVLREGLGAYLAVGFTALAIIVFSRFHSLLDLERRSTLAGGLALCVLIAMAIRLVILLHPQFYYPDVRVHSTFALVLARRGLAEFGAAFIENQFRWSLGLQQVGTHWYAMPYPPGFYVLASPLIALLGYRAEVAVEVLAAAFNSLEALAVFAIARGLGLTPRSALASSAAVPLLPLFLARLSLAYFPAIVGHTLDAMAIAFLLAARGSLASRRSLLWLASLLALSFLAYTQSVLSLTLLLGLFLCFELIADRTAEARRRALAVTFALALAGAAAFGLFYVRYVPALRAMGEGRAVNEERILLERFEREERTRAAAPEELSPEEPDPYAGAHFDLLRGMRKAGWRLYIFYGVFAPVVVWGFVRLALTLTGSQARFTWAWALTYVALNFGSGSLPGPNLLRYNKDLELIAPLACVSIGGLLLGLWGRGDRFRRFVAAGLALGWTAFGATRAVQYLTATFVLER